MYKFDEQALRKGINMGLGSQGIWTPELENVMFDEIINESLRIHDVVGRSEEIKPKSFGSIPKESKDYRRSDDAIFWKNK